MLGTIISSYYKLVGTVADPTCGFLKNIFSLGQAIVPARYYQVIKPRSYRDFIGRPP